MKLIEISSLRSRNYRKRARGERKEEDSETYRRENKKPKKKRRKEI